MELLNLLSFNALHFACHQVKEIIADNSFINLYLFGIIFTNVHFDFKIYLQRLLCLLYQSVHVWYYGIWSTFCYALSFSPRDSNFCIVLWPFCSGLSFDPRSINLYPVDLPLEVS